MFAEQSETPDLSYRNGEKGLYPQLRKSSAFANEHYDHLVGLGRSSSERAAEDLIEVAANEIFYRRLLLQPRHSEDLVLKNVIVPIFDHLFYWLGGCERRFEYPVGKKYSRGRVDLAFFAYRSWRDDGLLYPVVFVEAKLRESDLPQAAEQLAYYASVGADHVIGIACTAVVWEFYVFGVGLPLEKSMFARWDAREGTPISHLSFAIHDDIDSGCHDHLPDHSYAFSHAASPLLSS